MIIANLAEMGRLLLIYRRDISSLLLPLEAGSVVDLGCGRGELVRLLQADGFDTEGIDINPEQAALAGAAGVARVRGDFCAILATRSASYTAIAATGSLEHLTKPEVLHTFHDWAATPAPGVVFVDRVPNAVRSLGGHIRGAPQERGARESRGEMMCGIAGTTDVSERAECE